jgi:hypothetical protein
MSDVQKNKETQTGTDSQKKNMAFTEPKFHHSTDKSQSMDLILSHSNLVRLYTLNFPKIHFNIILPFTLSSPKRHFL